MIYRTIFLVAYLGAVTSVWANPQAGRETSESHDLLNLERGAVMLSYSSQWSEEWAALLILDDTAKRGWSAAEDAEFPHEMVVELANPSELAKFAIDNSGALEKDNPGISARAFELWASTQGPDKGYDLILDAQAQQGERAVFPLKEKPRARWLKLVIKSNWGHPDYTELMELEAYGRILESPQDRPPLTGVYDTNYDLLLFEQNGRQVHGCYDHDDGQLAGTTDGRTVQFEWRENEGKEIGTAIMVLAESGDLINGLWYQHSEYQGLWTGSRAAQDVRPDCTLPPTDNLAKSLNDSGRAILYGLNFEVDSAQLRADSEVTLREALEMLKNDPQLNLVIEGHTDDRGEPTYNKGLSQRRAESVVNWLIDRGIDASRLAPRGLGESEPMASNDSAQGRALNRRVELKRKP